MALTLGSGPFLTAQTFATWAKQRQYANDPVATSTLTVVSDWIRQNAVEATTDQAAKLVTFEVTREALAWGKYGGLTTFEEKVGPRAKSGTFADVERFVTSRHRHMLGIGTVTAAPRGSFKAGDY